MPRYDFRCRACGDTFEVNRPMTSAGDPAACPAGHSDTVKLLSTVAVGGVAARGGTTQRAAGASSAAPAGGGCCGGGCCS